MTAVNWNLPDNDTPNVDAAFAAFREREAHIAAMNYSGDSNVPTSAIRWNSTNKALDQWSGSAWAQIFGAAQIDHDALFNYSANKHPDKTGSVTISGTWTFTAAPYFEGDLRFSGAQTEFYIYGNSSEGSDNRMFGLMAGGGTGYGRGAHLYLYGNEYTTVANREGDFMLCAGDGAQGRGLFYSNNALRVTIPKNGGLAIHDITSATAPSSGALFYGDAGQLKVLPTSGPAFTCRSCEIGSYAATTLISRTPGAFGEASAVTITGAGLNLFNVRPGDYIEVSATVSCGLTAFTNSAMAVAAKIGTVVGPWSTTQQVGAAACANTIAVEGSATGLTGTVAIALVWFLTDAVGETMNAKHVNLQVKHFRATA